MTVEFIDVRQFARVALEPGELFSNSGDSAYFVTHGAAEFKCAPPVNLAGDKEGRLFRTSPIPHAYDEIHRSGPVHLAALTDARMISPHGFVFDAENRLIADSYHNRDMVGIPLKEAEDLCGELLAAGDLAQVEEPAFCLCGPWSWVYHHWLLETLPRLEAIQKFPELADCPIVVPGELNGFQLETLAALGIDQARLLPFDGSNWVFKKLYFPSYPAPGGHSLRQIEWLRRHLAPALDARANSIKSKRIYISRRDAEARQLVNEAEIETVLKARGFEIAVLSEMTVADQARLFGRGEIVVGTGGSGMTNMVFAQPEAKLLELHPASYINRAIWYLCSAAGQSYSYIIGSDGGSRHDYSVDPAALASALNQILKD
ncbi:MAG: glycosyltransferase family 61 protein [Rhodospirillales bacterium]|nr:glycosyltransferase family 61 protein [Rhodospirillales bacterium]